MSRSDLLTPLLVALRDLTAWFTAEAVSGVLIGGVAVSLLGRPRFTRDIDYMVVLDETRWEGFLASGTRFGFVPRRPDAIAFARKVRVLLVRHDPSGIQTDISFGALPFEHEAISRVIHAEVAGIDVALPTPEDLIIMKAVAHREQDMLDIRALLQAHPKLDRRRVRRWVREFAAVLERPEIFDDLQRLLTRQGGRRP